jgi:hypothetical protein
MHPANVTDHARKEGQQEKVSYFCKNAKSKTSNSRDLITDGVDLVGKVWAQEEGRLGLVHPAAQIRERDIDIGVVNNAVEGSDGGGSPAIKCLQE